jgi:hypothetical protein
MESAKVLYYLDLWKDYMKGNSGKSLGYPSKAAGFMSSGISSFDDMGDEIDITSARTVDQVIDDLPMLQKDAIYYVYLGQRCKMTDTQLQLNYDLALSNLQLKLTEKHLY